MRTIIAKCKKNYSVKYKSAHKSKKLNAEHNQIKYEIEGSDISLPNITRRKGISIRECESGRSNKSPV